MHAVQSLFVCLLSVGLFGCVSIKGAQPLPIRSLAKGAFSGIREARQEVINDAAHWEKLWNQHGTSTGSAEKIPAVDFSKEMVIVATMGTRRTGGYSIEIVRVAPTGKTLSIAIKQGSPPPGAITIQALTAPFHFVAVPRSDLKPEFVETDAAEKSNGEGRWYLPGRQDRTQVSGGKNRCWTEPTSGNGMIGRHRSILPAGS